MLGWESILELVIIIISFKNGFNRDGSGCWRRVLNWSKAYYKVIRYLLGRVDVVKFLGTSTADWESFKGPLINVLDQHVPVRRKDKHGKERGSWMTNEVLNLTRKRKKR